MVVLFFSALFQMLEILRYFRSHGQYRNFIYSFECISPLLAVTGKKIEGLPQVQENSILFIQLFNF